MKYLVISVIALFFMSFLTHYKVKTIIPSKAEDISPLLIGESLPNANLQNLEGKDINLKDVLKVKPTVLVFYRGGWCPYCNMQLSRLVKIEKEIIDLGFQIVAITPDDYQNLKNTEEKDSINYQLYSDPNGKLIQDVGIAFQTPTMVKGYIATKGQKGKTSDVMPVPTLMVVDMEGKIKFEYINPNYKERMSSEMLLAVLQTIK
jgi:peroxiredoxin